MANVSIMRAIQDYSDLFWSRTSGPVRRTLASKLALSGLLAGPPKGSEVGYGAPGATDTSTAGLDVLL